MALLAMAGADAPAMARRDGGRSADPAEAVDLRDHALAAHHLAAVRVVPERGVPLDRAELAAAEVLLDEPDVVGDAAVPVEDRDVARLRVGAADPLARRAQPRLRRRDVRAPVRVAAGALVALRDHLAGALGEAVADEDVAPG